MKHKQHLYLYSSIAFAILFVIWTLAVKFIDVKCIGPIGSNVGFSTINEFIRLSIGENLTLYYITDWLSIIPLLICFVYFIIGLFQLFRRKSIQRVDFDIISLGICYACFILVYFFFEKCIVNYRPLLIEGALEASYPSSTTMLSISILGTCAVNIRMRLKKTIIKKILFIMIILFSIFMVLGRFLSGVHWFTDIVGGILVSCCFVSIYTFLSILNLTEKKAR